MSVIRQKTICPATSPLPKNRKVAMNVYGNEKGKAKWKMKKRG